MDIKKGVLLLLLMRSGCVVYGASLCLLGDFDTQVNYLLENEMLSPGELREIALEFNELQEIMRDRWGSDADLFVFGSLLAGLGTKTSDLDVYLRIPSYNNKTHAYIFEETLKVLYQQTEKIGHIVPKPEKAIPRITYYDYLIHRYIDLSFRSGSRQETKLMAYYLNLDDRYLPLAAIIKFWCKVHQLTGKGLLSNYSVYLMITFYLQQKNMAPSGYALQAHLPPRYADKWNKNFEKISYYETNNETLYELLGGFFKFYSHFNFAKYCVSPFVGRPLAKSNFKDITNVPEEFSLYVRNVNNGYYHPLPIESEICVQDIFVHSVNTAQRVDKAGALNFIKHLKFASKLYDNLPSDMFLRSILTRRKHKQTYTVGKHLEVLTILKLKDCLIEKRNEEHY